MLFNSLEFIIFFPIVFAFYWLLKGKGYRGQNIFLLLGSYFFYGWWDWRINALVFFAFPPHPFGENNGALGRQINANSIAI